MKKKSFWPQGLAEAITHEKVGHFRFAQKNWQESPPPQQVPVEFWRLAIFYILIFLILLVFLGKLFTLTIVSGEKNRELSENNRVRLTKIESERGRIFDRNGKLLVHSQRVYLLKKGDQATTISANQAKELESEGLAGEYFEGNLGQIFQEVKRVYHLKEKAAHLLGYITRTREPPAGESSFVSDWIGQDGIEAVYDSFLKGKVGSRLIEVDAREKKVSILGERQPQDGQDLYLTIDLDLQKKVSEALQNGAAKAGTDRGAAIVTNIQTGEVLALVSVPSFDPQNIGQFIDKPGNPFFNRAVAGDYPPGSVFKIVSALAGLASGQITSQTAIEDVGEFYLGDNRFANWLYLTTGRRDGILTINRAIARSNDIFFYRLAQRVGLDQLRQMAQKLGFGAKTGIDLPAESFGLVPDGVWKKSAIGADWFPGDTLHLAIGQGFLQATPIQVNLLTTYLATGKLRKPYLVSKIGGDGEIVIQGKVLQENLVSEEYLKLIREGTRQACQKGGTGWPFFDAPYSVGCKTGTAERALGNPHAWFTAFAPFGNPQVAVTVIIEEGGEGSSVAGPVAREILDWWFKNKIKN